MYRIFQATISLFFFFFSMFGNVAYGSQSPKSLINIFCTELAVHGVEAVTSSAQWPEVTARLERNETGFEKLEVAKKPAFESCLEDFKSDFERAEFIRGGKLITQTQSRSIEGAESHEPVRIEVLASLGYADFRVPVDTTTEGKTFQADKEVKKRQQHYHSMWKKFLTDLRKKAQTL